MESNNMCLDTILDKINKLNKMAESAAAIGNEAEAGAFAQKVQTLLMQHKLDMSALNNFEDKDGIEIDEELFEWNIGNSNKRSHWLQSLANIVAHYNGCSIVAMKGTNKIWIVGTKESRQVTGYICQVLSRFGQENMDKEYRKSYYLAKKMGNTYAMKGWRRSFTSAYVSVIGQRISEEHARFMSDHVNERGLVVLDREKQAIKEWFDQREFNKGTGFSYGQRNLDGMIAGQSYGAKAQIHANAITSEGKRVQVIGCQS